MSEQRKDTKYFSRRCLRNSTSTSAQPPAGPEGVMAACTGEILGPESSADAFANMGFVYLTMQDFKGAVDCFSKAVELEPEKAEPYVNLGLAYERMERFGSAKQMYKKALTLQPEAIDAVIRLARIADIEGDYYGAEKGYRRAIEIAPSSADTHFLLAVLYDDYDMFDEAMAEYGIALEIDPGHLRAALNLGILNAQLGDHRSAIALIKRVVDMNPNHTEARNLLGSMYEVTGMTEEAEREYRLSLRLDLLQEDIHISLARLQYLKSRSYPFRAHREDALRRIQLVLSLNPENERAQKLLKCIIENTEDATMRRNESREDAPAETGIR